MEPTMEREIVELELPVAVELSNPPEATPEMEVLVVGPETEPVPVRKPGAERTPEMTPAERTTEARRSSPIRLSRMGLRMGPSSAIGWQMRLARLSKGMRMGGLSLALDELQMRPSGSVMGLP
jgi:hypothetical protein